MLRNLHAFCVCLFKELFVQRNISAPSGNCLPGAGSGVEGHK